MYVEEEIFGNEILGFNPHEQDMSQAIRLFLNFLYEHNAWKNCSSAK